MSSSLFKLSVVFVIMGCVYQNVSCFRIQRDVQNSAGTTTATTTEIENITHQTTDDSAVTKVDNIQLDIQSNMEPKISNVETSLDQNNMGLDIEKKLYYSKILRDNVGSAIGTLIYTYSTAITNTQLDALRHLQKAILDRQYLATNLLPLIETSDKKNSKDQLIDLFNILTNTINDKHNYRAKMCLKALQNDEWNEILNRLKINLFENINIDEAKKYACTITGDVDTFEMISKKITDALSNQEIMSTSDLVAELMMSLPINNNAPEILYAENIVYKFLSEFHESTKPATKVSSVYDMINYIFTELAQVPDVSKSVRDSITILLPFINNASTAVEQKEEIDPDIVEMRTMLNNSNINIEKLFSEFNSEKYPKDIVKSRNMLMSAFKDGLIVASKFFANFDKYKYSNKDHLLLAVLNKLQKSAVFPANLSGLIKSLYIHAKMKLETVNEKPVQLRGDPDVEELLNSYENVKNENRYDELIKTINNIRYQLLNQNVNWSKLIDFKYNQFTEARHAVHDLLHLLSLKSNLNMGLSKNLYKLITTYLTLVDENGEPLTYAHSFDVLPSGEPHLNEDFLIAKPTIDSKWNTLRDNEASNFENLLHKFSLKPVSNSYLTNYSPLHSEHSSYQIPSSFSLESFKPISKTDYYPTNSFSNFSSTPYRLPNYYPENTLSNVYNSNAMTVPSTFSDKFNVPKINSQTSNSYPNSFSLDSHKLQFPSLSELSKMSNPLYPSKYSDKNNNLPQYPSTNYQTSTRAFDYYNSLSNYSKDKKSTVPIIQQSFDSYKQPDISGSITSEYSVPWSSAQMSLNPKTDNSYLDKSPLPIFKDNKFDGKLQDFQTSLSFPTLNKYSTNYLPYSKSQFINYNKENENLAKIQISPTNKNSTFDLTKNLSKINSFTNVDYTVPTLEIYPKVQQFVPSMKVKPLVNSQAQTFPVIGLYLNRNAKQLPLYQEVKSTVNTPSLNNLSPIPSRYLDKFNNFPIIPQSELYLDPNIGQLSPQEVNTKALAQIYR